MGRIIIGTGARGDLVRRVQTQLIPFGFRDSDVDGMFGSITQQAVLRYQKSHGLEASGDVDVETWQSLLGAVPDVQQRALGVTAAFEGHGYSLAEGNFDGAGVTWGIIGFTLANGELGALLTTIQERHPDALRDAFGDRSEELLEVLTWSRTRQIAWADQISLGRSKAPLAQPWRDGFAQLGLMPEVQAIQRERVEIDYFAPARETAAEYELSNELGIALAFDIHVQNGGINSGAAQEIAQHLAAHSIVTELEHRVIIANAVADNARPKYREDVRARKLTLATGTGKVHDQVYVLRNWGLQDVPA